VRSLIIILLCFLLFFFCQKSSNKSSKISSVESIEEFALLKTWPTETDSILLAQPTQLEIDEKMNIYVCDFMANTIIKYGNTGDFITKIGQKGHGPGEFIQQSVFSLNEERLFVVDQAHRRIQIFTTDGTFQYSFKTFTSPTSLICFNEKLYTYAPERFFVTANKKIPLINVIDTNGRVISKFGDFLSFNNSIVSFASNCLLKFYDNRLFVLFQYYPLLRIYSPEGKLMQEIQFDELDYKKLAPGNYKWEYFTNKNSISFPFRWIFRAFDVNDDGVFIGLFADDLIIDWFTHDGSIVKRFIKFHRHDNHIYLHDFKAISEKSNLKFIILDEDNFSKIEIYTAHK